MSRGAGFEFVNEVVGGVIPSQFFPAVEKGVRQLLEDLGVEIVDDGEIAPVFIGGNDLKSLSDAMNLPLMQL